MHTQSIPRFAVLACGLLVTLFLFPAGAEDSGYEIAQPVTLTIGGQDVSLAVGDPVDVIGTLNPKGNTMIRITLPDGSITMGQIPTEDIREKGATPAPMPTPSNTPPPPSTAMGTAASSDGLADQFKFNSGGSDSGGTALHTNWKLVWEDDFSRDSQIDKNKWNFEIDGKGGGNGEQEYYTDSPKNAQIENGELVITAIKDDGGHKFTSARMTTKGKFSTLYGRIEACIKAPKAQAGNWPAFWMMPEDSKYGGWPRSGEIDIMELINKSDILYGTDHFGGPGDTHEGAKIASPGGDWSKDYHVYAIEWEPKVMRWYVDGKYYGSINDWHSQNGKFPAPFDQKFFIILNYAVGGAWPRSPDNNSKYPQSMHVKYVRVYKP